MFVMWSDARNHWSFVWSLQFFKPLWQRILQCFGINRIPGNWYDEIIWVERHVTAHSSSERILQCLVYQIWIERNSRLHGKTARNVDQIIEDIRRKMKIKTIAFQHVQSDAVNIVLPSNWSLDSSILIDLLNIWLYRCKHWLYLLANTLFAFDNWENHHLSKKKVILLVRHLA